MALVDTLNRTITEASQAWDDSGLLCILTALVVPVVAWLVRKPLANLVFKLFNAIVYPILWHPVMPTIRHRV